MRDISMGAVSENDIMTNTMKRKVFFEEFESFYYFHGDTQNWKMEGMHFHKQYEIVLFMSDGIRMEIGDRVFQAGKGDLFFINNKEYHRSIGKQGGVYSRYVLMFEPDQIEQISKAFGFDFLRSFEDSFGERDRMLHLSGENLRLVEEKMAHIESVVGLDMENENNRVRLRLNLLGILNTLDFLLRQFMTIQEGRLSEKSEEGQQEPIPYRDRIEEIKKYIVRHVEERLDLDDIADHFYMNRYYLSHYFKKETGFTLIQYITNQKILAAKKMLKRGMSVTEVAMRLSYNSDSHFITVFKKVTGTTPKRYAKEKNSNNV